MGPRPTCEVSDRPKIETLNSLTLAPCSLSLSLSLSLFKVYFFILRERGKEFKGSHTQLGEEQRERGRERITSRDSDSLEPDTGLDLTNCEIMTCAKIESDA